MPPQISSYDLICGVSVGGLLAIGLGLLGKSWEEVNTLTDQVGSEVFGHKSKKTPFGMVRSRCTPSRLAVFSFRPLSLSSASFVLDLPCV